jgi:hypothetical protein
LTVLLKQPKGLRDGAGAILWKLFYVCNA